MNSLGQKTSSSVKRYDGFRKHYTTMNDLLPLGILSLDELQPCKEVVFHMVEFGKELVSLIRKCDIGDIDTDFYEDIFWKGKILNESKIYSSDMFSPVLKFLTRVVDHNNKEKKSVDIYASKKSSNYEYTKQITEFYIKFLEDLDGYYKSSDFFIKKKGNNGIFSSYDVLPLKKKQVKKILLLYERLIKTENKIFGVLSCQKKIGLKIIEIEYIKNSTLTKATEMIKYLDNQTKIESPIQTEECNKLYKCAALSPIKSKTLNCDLTTRSIVSIQLTHFDRDVIQSNSDRDICLKGNDSNFTPSKSSHYFNQYIGIAAVIICLILLILLRFLRY